MDLSYARGSGCRRAVVVTLFLGFLLFCHACAAHAQLSVKPEKAPAEASGIKDVRSRHFFLHTDLARSEADQLVERLEVLLDHISTYWGQPMRGLVECTVIRNLKAFPVNAIKPDGERGVKSCGGVTLMYFHHEGKRQVVKSAVFALARLEVLQHELVHAYCHQTFGRVGPIWYSEGMAETAHYWKEGDPAVHADSREIEFLRDHPPKSLDAVLSPTQVTGDCWQNYASRWALCHFLVSNPNYSRQFRQLGRGLLTGKDVSFQRTYAAVTPELFFEYRCFLRHISEGYRVDLCAWNWKKKFAGLERRQSQTAAIGAGRGWQPSGLSIRAGATYEYLATGVWQIAGGPEAVDADGDAQHRGRLVGVLMKDRKLGEEFELGVKGSLRLEADGDLYLRCRNGWNELAGDHGRITVRFQLEAPK
jgi:hypothetical protein